MRRITAARPTPDRRCGLRPAQDVELLLRERDRAPGQAPLHDPARPARTPASSTSTSCCTAHGPGSRWGAAPRHRATRSTSRARAASSNCARRRLAPVRRRRIGAAGDRRDHRGAAGRAERRAGRRRGRRRADELAIGTDVRTGSTADGAPPVTATCCAAALQLILGCRTARAGLPARREPGRGRAARRGRARWASRKTRSSSRATGTWAAATARRARIGRHDRSTGAGLTRPSLPTSSTWRSWSPPTTASTPIRPIPEQRVASARPGIAARRSTIAFNEDHILATSQAICEYRAGAGHRRSAVPRRRHARAVASRRPTSRARGVRRQRRRACSSTRAAATRRRRRCRARSSRTTRGRTPRPRRRRRRHAVAQPARATAASSTTRRTAARPAPTSPAGSRTAPTSCSRRELDGVRRVALRASPRGDAPATTSSTRTSARCRSVDRPRRDPRGRRPHRRRPARRRQRRPTGARSATRYGLDLTVVNPDVDPTFGFMTLDWDGKIRMDCSSPYAMAVADRAPARLRHRDRQRHRRRPARHRHPRRRPDEPEPLPRGRDRLPVRAPRAAGRPTPRSARRWSARR